MAGHQKMIKYKYIAAGVLFFLCLKGNNAFAQYGNEWINFNQQYYKISTGQNGIYRVTYDDLQNKGFPVSTVDPRRLKLFHRGTELAIHFQGQSDARFDPSDYLEFYGKKNDGAMDRELYISDDAQPHSYYNIYSDTTAYFLTWSLDGSNGKRIQKFKENNIDNLPAETFHFDEKVILQTNRYSVGLHYPIGQPSAENYITPFDYGEGWTGPAIRKGQSTDFTFTGLSNFYNLSAETPRLEMVLIGANNLQHKADIYVGPNASSLRLLTSAEFSSYYSHKVDEELLWSDLASSSQLVVRMVVTGVSTAADFVSVSLVKLVYPEIFAQNDLTGKNYLLTANANNKSYLEISDVPTNTRLFDVTNEANLIEIEYNRTGTDINAIVPNTNSARKILATSDYFISPKIESVAFTNINPAQCDYVIITHPSLRQSADNYPDVIKAYASYRSSAQGGNYDTLTFDVGRLYDQFNYGEVSSLALYHFLDFLSNETSTKHVFIIGKGLTPNYNSHRQDFGSQTYPDLVPTGGYPGSDCIFSAGTRSATHKHKLPVGRLAVTKPEDVASYLEKVKEMESQGYEELWRKDLIHLSGGGSANEQQIFRIYVESFERIAENEFLGGRVVTQSKKTNNETELINISDEVNKGKSLITFFGHSSTSITDIDIGFVSNDALGYNNKGKYPAIIVNGCNAGDTYYPGIGFGLDWIVTPEKGAIAFIAHTGTGNSSTLRRYTSLFYEVGFGDSLYIEKGIGEIQKELSSRYLDRYINDPINVAQAQQMALIGDPAVKLFGAHLPDYSISSNDVSVKSIDGNPVNAFSEKFNLVVGVKNFGKAIIDGLDILVTRQLSNGNSIQLDTTSYKATFYKDTLSIEITSAGIESYGINRFTITLDPANKISELSETNNTAVFEYFLPLGGMINRYPDNFQVVDTTNFSLIAQSLDLLMGERQVVIELDTTDNFNSPLFTTATIDGKVIYKWPVSIDVSSIDDSTVFYWRSKFAQPREGELDEWSQTSFTFIKNGDEGWDMSHFPEFKATDNQFIVHNSGQRKWDFEQFATNLFVRTFGANNGEFDFNDVEVSINEAAYIYPGQLCTNNSLNILGFRSSTTTPYKLLDFPGPDILDRRNCGRVPQVINNILNNELIPPREYLLTCIEAAAQNDFVVLFSIGNVEYGTIPATTLNALETIGVDISAFTALNPGEPVIIIGQKGLNPGEAIFITSDPASATPTDEQEISTEEIINGTIVEGTITSPVIGPSVNWDHLYFSITSLDNPNSDVNEIEIIGINDSNQETVLYQYILSSPFDLAGIDPQQYPKIKLRLNTNDETNLTPGQLQNWMVTYEGVPEGILTFNDDAENQLKVQEGESLVSNWAFENISNKNYQDSINVSIEYANTSLNQVFHDTVKIARLDKWASTNFNVNIDTRGKAGEGALKVFANPYEQIEKTYNNNLISIENYAVVSPDQSNPILEVTFDGSFIIDGDIVSPSPEILIRVKDENTVLLKEDTLGMEIKLKRPCDGCDFERIYFSNPNVSWEAATENSNFRVVFKPQNLEDGIYTLSVQASDESGNQAGAEPYRVNFEVINESTVTNFFPYPNPFSTSVRFVFTLTGNELPDDLIIQIMTVSGTVVREITMAELGQIKIGNNLSEYAWNGKDEFGDQLANGVYLYRVKIYKNGQPMKLRATSADRAFKHGVGKMYLLR